MEEGFFQRAQSPFLSLRYTLQLRHCVAVHANSPQGFSDVSGCTSIAGLDHIYGVER